MNENKQLDFFIKEITKPENNDTLYCRKCKTDKDLDQFSPCAITYQTQDRNNRLSGVTGTAAYCKTCRSDYQMGVAIAKKFAPPRPSEPIPCEICQQLTEPKELHLDHDHKGHFFRGWLCRTCNVGLGALGDSIEGLEVAIKYLEKANGRQS